MRSKRPGRMPGNVALLDPDVRQVPGAPGGGVHRGRGDIARQQRVAAPGEQVSEHADGAAGLEGAAVPGRRELRQADRVFALLVPAVLEAPGIARGLVHGIEVARSEGDGSRQRSSTSCSRVKCATMPGGSTGPRRPPVGELAGERADSRPLAGRDLGRERDPAGPLPRDPPVTGLRPVPHPDRVAQHLLGRLPGCPAGGTARGLVVGVGVRFPRREADPESGAQLAQAGG